MNHSYLIFSIIGYAFLSFATLVDKTIVNKNIPNPVVYTFYVGILSVVTFALIPFGFYLPGFWVMFLSALSALGFVMGLLLYYEILKVDEASRVSPVVGTLNSLLTLLIGALIFSQTITLNQTFASLVLLLGLVILSSTTWMKSRLERHHIFMMIKAALMMSISVVLLREIFLRTTFINGLIWVHIFTTILTLSFLLFPKYRRNIFNSKVTGHHFFNGTSLLLLGGQIIGGAGSFLLNFAVSLVSPAIVNSLQGVQYLLILVIVLFMSKHRQHLLGEELNKKIITQKIIGSIVILSGLYILAFT